MDRFHVMQLVKDVQRGEITRRDFLTRAAVAVGSTTTAALLLAACDQAATEPAPPPTLTASAAEESASEGLSVENVTYPDQDGETLNGYLAQPAGDGTYSAVVVIQEWWGLDEHIRDITRRLANEGFIALAPDLYHGQVATEPDAARKLVMALDMKEAVREIQQAISFLQQQPRVAGSKVGLVGFCMGGRLALATALAEEALGAVVVYYGTPLTPNEVKAVKAPILGLYGAKDSGIPLIQVQIMQEALDEAGIKHSIQIYEDAPHAFLNDTRDSYTPAAAGDAWQRTLAWFRENL